MGIVIRQGIYSSIISYLGVGIGYLNLLILFPKFLQPEQIGLLRTIQDAAILFAPFAQIGLGPAIIRFFPQFSGNRTTIHSFITFALLTAIGGYGLFLLAYFSLQDSIALYFQDKAADVLQYTNLVLWLTFILLIRAILEFFGRSLLKVSFPNFLNEVLIRLIQGILVTLYFVNLFSFKQFLIFNILGYLLALIILIVYLIKDGHLKLNFNFRIWNTGKLKEFFSFSFLMLVGNSSMMVVGKVDSLMVTAMIGLEMNAIYVIAFYIATVIEIPKRSLSQLAMPLLSQAHDKNEIKEIHNLYHRTAINQMIIGLLILLGVFANLNNLFELMPNGDFYRSGIYVVLIVGFGKWIDMAFGPSSEIIILSKYYWLNIILIVFLAAMVVISNQILIPIYGINGAAIGTAGVLFIFNTAKCMLVYFMFRIWPFNVKSLIVIAIGLVVAVGIYFLPALSNPILDIIVRSASITIVFGALILITKVSDEAWRVVNGVLNRLGIKR